MPWFGADSLANGGFGALTLTTSDRTSTTPAARGAIQVLGNVSLSASRQISIADNGVLSLAADTSGTTPLNPVLTLTAPYVMLGQPFQPPTQTATLTTGATAGRACLRCTPAR